MVNMTQYMSYTILYRWPESCSLLYLSQDFIYKEFLSVR